MAEKAHIDHAICEARLAGELQEAARATGLLSHVATYGDGALERLMLSDLVQPLQLAAIKDPQGKLVTIGPISGRMQ